MDDGEGSNMHPADYTYRLEIDPPVSPALVLRCWWPTDRRLSHRWIAAKASLKSRSRDSLPDTTPESMRRRSSVRRINRGRIALENRPPSRCSNPRLTHFNGPNSADDLPLWQMPIAHNQPLAILITSILVELNVVHYLVFDRFLQQPVRSFPEQLFQKRLLFIFS